MCGRYNIITDAQALVDAFQIVSSDLDFSAVDTKQYNISPSKVGAAPADMHKAPIIRMYDGKAQCINAVWPLVPQWAKGQIPKYATANARAESMKTANSYKHAWSHQQRCLVPASGFYEWQVQEEGPKQPYHIQVKGQPVFAMAGLWESSSDGNQTVESFTIVTTDANGLMAEIHNSKQRMPVILSPALYKTWLEGSSTAAESCVKSLPDSQLQAHKISRKVNNPQYNEEDILAPM